MGFVTNEIKDVQANWCKDLNAEKTLGVIVKEEQDCVMHAAFK